MGAGIDPVSMGLSGLQAVAGIAQTIGGMVQQKRALKALNKLQTPTYTANQGILDYYNKALQRYNVNPTDSALYKMQQQNIQRGTSQGLSALGDRRSALAGISNLVQGQNDAMLKAGVAAEGERNQRFNQLGAATGMKAEDDLRGFQYNKIAPYEKQYNLLAMKAAGGAQIMNSGMQNIFGAASNASSMYSANKMYNQK